jgi:hypothetical protein
MTKTEIPGVGKGLIKALASVQNQMLQRRSRSTRFTHIARPLRNLQSQSAIIPLPCARFSMPPMSVNIQDSLWPPCHLDLHAIPRWRACTQAAPPCLLPARPPSHRPNPLPTNPPVRCPKLKPRAADFTSCEIPLSLLLRLCSWRATRCVPFWREIQPHAAP